MNVCKSFYDTNYTQDHPVRILSIDGGGIRGISPAMMIAEVEKRTNKKAVELFDLIAGVSIGSFIGAGLAFNMAGDELVRIWEHEANRLFQCSPFRKMTTLDGLLAPKWPIENLMSLVTRHFGDTLLTDANTELVCPSFETTTAEPWYFSRNIARSDQRFSHLRVRDAILSSGAAPAYFRSFEQVIDNQELNFIDGAVFSPNPSAVAHSCAGDTEHSLILSLGTGRRVNSISFNESAGWGFLGWVTSGEITDLISQGTAQNTHKLMKKILDDNHYFRWQIKLERKIKLDDANQVPYMKEVTNKYIGDNDKEISRVCDIFNAASNR